MVSAQRHGKVALVTAGASDIGREIVLQLLAKGAQVIAADIDEKALTASASDARPSSDRLHCLRYDIAKATDVAHLAETVAGFGLTLDFCSTMPA